MSKAKTSSTRFALPDTTLVDVLAVNKETLKKHVLPDVELGRWLNMKRDHRFHYSAFQKGFLQIEG